MAAGGSPVVKAWSNGHIALRTANGNVLRAVAADLPAPQEISGEWNLSFPPNWGAPPSVTLDKLISWTDHTNDGVRYFSGTATYEKEIEIPADQLTAGRELWLDLGAVKNFAEVSLNGQDFGVLWKPPFRVNVTAAAKPGVNKLSSKSRTSGRTGSSATNSCRRMSSGMANSLRPGRNGCSTASPAPPAG